MGVTAAYCTYMGAMGSSLVPRATGRHTPVRITHFRVGDSQCQFGGRRQARAKRAARRSAKRDIRGCSGWLRWLCGGAVGSALLLRVGHCRQPNLLHLLPCLGDCVLPVANHVPLPLRDGSPPFPRIPRGRSKRARGEVASIHKSLCQLVFCEEGFVAAVMEMPGRLLTRPAEFIPDTRARSYVQYIPMGARNGDTPVRITHLRVGDSQCQFGGRRHARAKRAARRSAKREIRARQAVRRDGKRSASPIGGA